VPTLATPMDGSLLVVAESLLVAAEYLPAESRPPAMDVHLRVGSVVHPHQ